MFKHWIINTILKNGNKFDFSLLYWFSVWCDRKMFKENNNDINPMIIMSHKVDEDKGQMSKTHI